MPDWLLSVVRTTVQSALAAGGLWLAGHGLAVPEAVTSWAQLAALAAAVAAWTAAVRWLETRTGDDPGARVARLVARLLMLGIGTRQPVYMQPGESAQVASGGRVVRL